MRRRLRGGALFPSLLKRQPCSGILDETMVKIAVDKVAAPPYRFSDAGLELLLPQTA